jgi:pyruvate dehydrogenase E2 component (dihydrolipoamide acetyltransferase)
MIVLPSTVRPVHSPPTLPPVAAPVGIYADFVLSDSAVVLAARQTAAKQSVPHYYLSIELNLSNVMKLRSDLNNKLSSVATGRKDRPSTGLLSVLDFLVKASALAMKQVTYGLDSQTVVKLVLPHDMSLLLLC